MFQNAEATSPTSDVPKTDEQKSAQDPDKVTNGEASAEELSKPEEAAADPATDAAKPEEETKPITDQPTEPAVEEPKVPEPVVEKPVESAPSPVKEDVPPVEEPTPKVEEPKSIEPTPVVEETKEVRSEEVPPPLPSSNPPSPVTVFAESTKADALPADQVPLETPLTAPVVETIPEQVAAEQSIDSIPQATSSPVVENVSELESAPLVEGKVESVSSDTSVIPEQSQIVDEPSPPKYESNETDLNTPSAESSLPALDGTVISPSVEQQITPISTAPVETVKESTKEPETNPIPPAVETQSEPIPVEGKVESLESITEQPKPSETLIESSNPDLLSENKSLEPQEISEQQPSVESSESLIAVEETKSPEVPIEKVESSAVAVSPVQPSPAVVSDSVLAPTSPPPSPAVVSASESLPDPLVPSPEPTPSLLSEKAVSSTEEVLPEPVTEQLPEPISESVVNADSLPDISTESLPSLPEPVSENLAEPMSLPPVDSVPEPIATDSVPECPVSDDRPSTDSPVLTNGNANGLPSPTDEVSPQAVKEGPLKQVNSES